MRQQRIQLSLIHIFIGVGLSLWNLGGALVSLSQGKDIVFQFGIPYENALAAVLFATGMAGFGLLKDARRNDIRFPYLCTGMLLIAVTFVWIGSRMMLVMSIALIAAWILVKFLRGRKRTKMICVSAGILLIILCVFAFASPTVQSALGQAMFGVTELNERFAYYHDSIQLLTQHPLGLGPGGWTSRQAEFQSALYFVRFAHSSLFQAIVDGGYVSLALFGMIAVAPMITTFKKAKAIKQLRIIYIMNIILLLQMCIRDRI